MIQPVQFLGGPVKFLLSYLLTKASFVIDFSFKYGRYITEIQINNAQLSFAMRILITILKEFLKSQMILMSLYVYMWYVMVNVAD